MWRVTEIRPDSEARKLAASICRCDANGKVVGTYLNDGITTVLAEDEDELREAIDKRIRDKEDFDRRRSELEDRCEPLRIEFGLYDPATEQEAASAAADVQEDVTC